MFVTLCLCIDAVNVATIANLQSPSKMRRLPGQVSCQCSYNVRTDFADKARTPR